MGTGLVSVGGFFPCVSIASGVSVVGFNVCLFSLPEANEIKVEKKHQVSDMESGTDDEFGKQKNVD